MHVFQLDLLSDNGAVRQSPHAVAKPKGHVWIAYPGDVPIGLEVNICQLDRSGLTRARYAFSRRVKDTLTGPTLGKGAKPADGVVVDNHHYVIGHIPDLSYAPVSHP
jgi:hypothetical protein